MTRTMRAALVDGSGSIRIVDKPIPAPGPGEVLIRVGATGVCGTDLHLIQGDYPHGRYPVTPGHEFAGWVAATGTGVDRVVEGEFVGVDPNVSCGECHWCRQHATNLCVRLEPVGVSVDGSCAEYVVVPERIAYGLPDGVDDVAGPLVEPLSCVLHAVERTPGWRDSRVAVFGGGPIGLIAVALARHAGVASISVFEPHEPRRSLALVMGADTAEPPVAGDEARELEPFDIAIEASGHSQAVQAAIDVLGARGRLVQMGVASPEATVRLNPYDVFAKELMLIGSMSLADAYPRAVDLITELAPTLRPLVTDRVPLEEYAEAVRLAASPHSIKVQVVS